MEQTDGCQRGGEEWIKEGEENSQRTRVHNPWTQTTVWGQSEGRQVGQEEVCVIV